MEDQSSGLGDHCRYPAWNLPLMHFSLTRLLLAVTAFATAFGAFSYLGFAGIAVSTLIGVSVGAICLIVKPDQIWPMVRTGLITILGGFIGLMFCPMVHPPYNPGDEFGCIGMGGIVGFLIGISMTASQRTESNATNERKRKNAG